MEDTKYRERERPKGSLAPQTTFIELAALPEPGSRRNQQVDEEKGKIHEGDAHHHGPR